jgi:hypothetical protein
LEAANAGVQADQPLQRRHATDRMISLVTHTEPGSARFLDVSAVIAAHVQWKKKLEGYIEGSGEPLEASVVGSDRHCQLGKWLAGEGRAYESSAEYREARDMHARFHTCAAEVVRAVQRDDREGARRLLAPRSEFRRCSEALVRLLASLKGTVGGANNTPSKVV